MSEQANLVSIGWHKGEMDFSVSALVGKLTHEQMTELRAMICVAIGITENTFRMGVMNQAEERAS